MMIEKWIDEYINGADISKIKWLYLNNYGLSSFFKDNYYDDKLMMYIYDEKKYKPIGMYYIDYDGFPGFNYLIGVCPNKVGKYTLLSCLAFVDNYKLFSDQEDYITYLSTIEVNKYFRGMGLAQETIKNLYVHLKPYQNVLTSGLSPMGRQNDMLNKAIKILRECGFKMDIRSDIEDFDLEEYHELVKRRER